MAEECVSCGRDIITIEDSIVFDCPKCGARIVRCGDCRRLGVNYTCQKCGFEGP